MPTYPDVIGSRSRALERPPEVGSGNAGPPRRPVVLMRLVTVNVLHGMSIGGGGGADRFAAEIASLDADVLGLQ